MHIKLNQRLKDIFGNDLYEIKKETDSEGKEVEKKEYIFLKSIMMNSLLGIYKGEEGLTGEEKLKRWQLAIKIRESNDSIELTAEEISLIKLLISKMYTTVITGQAYEMLENTKEVKNG